VHTHPPGARAASCLRVRFGSRQQEAFRAGDTVQLKRAGQSTSRLGSAEDVKATQDRPVHWAAGAIGDEWFVAEVEVPYALQGQFNRLAGWTDAPLRRCEATFAAKGHGRRPVVLLDVK